MARTRIELTQQRRFIGNLSTLSMSDEFGFHTRIFKRADVSPSMMRCQILEAVFLRVLEDKDGAGANGTWT